jgi:hypothetical protein
MIGRDRLPYEWSPYEDHDKSDLSELNGSIY